MTAARSVPDSHREGPRGAPAAPPSPLRRALAGARRSVLTWRRPLAALLAAVAVLAGVRAAAAPPPPTTDVVVAARDLPGGRPLSAVDLTSRSVPQDAVPAGASRSAVALIGRTLAAPLREGEAVTDVRVVGEGLLSGYPTRVASPVRVADAGAVRLLRVGDRVDVVATDPSTGRARVVSPAAPVVALPRESRSGSGPGSSSLSGGALVVVAVPPTTAVDLAGAAASDLLSLILIR